MFFIKNVFTVSSGVKRFECFTKKEAMDQIYNLKKIVNSCTEYFKTPIDEIENGIEKQNKTIPIHQAK